MTAPQTVHATNLTDRGVYLDGVGVIAPGASAEIPAGLEDADELATSGVLQIDAIDVEPTSKATRGQRGGK